MSQSKTPKIRFPEFTEDWQKKRLDEIFTERKESCIISEEYPQLAFTIAEGVINPEDKKTNKRDFLIKDIETKKFAVTEVDDIIYNPANLKFGAIHRNKLKRGGVSPIYAIFSTEQLPAFMEYLVKRPSFIQESLKYLEGTVIKLMTLKPRDFLLMETYIPSIPEQEKIADLFTTLDSYIEIETKKTDSYKTLKASMLQKMFPQQGSLEPEIRFPGFTEPWEQRKLGEMCQITMGQSPDGSTYSEEPSDYILVQGNADLKDGWVYPRIWTTQKTKTAQAGDLIMSVRAPAGAMGKTAYDVVLGRGVAGIKGNEFVYQSLVKMDLDGYWKKMAAGSTFESINSDVVKNAEMIVPQDIEEQEKIGVYFKQLDTLITLHQRKCEQLQLLKHALQQKMFV